MRTIDKTLNVIPERYKGDGTMFIYVVRHHKKGERNFQAHCDYVYSPSKDDDSRIRQNINKIAGATVVNVIGNVNNEIIPPIREALNDINTQYVEPILSFYINFSE